MIKSWNKYLPVILILVVGLNVFLVYKLYFTQKLRQQELNTNLTSYPEQIKSVLDKQVHDWNSGNLTEFMVGYHKSPELLFITKNGVTRGHNTILNRYRKAFPTKSKMGQLQFTDLVFDPLTENHEFQLVNGQWEVMAEDTSSGHFSLVFKLIEGQWKIVVDHTW